MHKKSIFPPMRSNVREPSRKTADGDFVNIVIYCQQLRSKFLNCSPPIIRSRRQFFRLYPNVFLGKDFFTWHLEQEALVAEKNNNCSNTDSYLKDNVKDLSESDITKLFQHLIELDLIQKAKQNASVLPIPFPPQNEVPLKIDNTLYRLTGDDIIHTEKTDAYVKGYQLYFKTQCENCSILQKVFQQGVLLSDRCMQGKDLLKIVIEGNISPTYDSAIQTLNRCLKHNILIATFPTKPEFEERKFYMFTVDFSSKALSTSEIYSLTKSICNPNEELSELNLTPEPLPPYDSLLKEDGSETIESLQHPDAPFNEKELRIIPDKLGYGFIIRGKGPCFVKNVDPDSPAGKAGLKAYQFITRINGKDVLRQNPDEIENLIISGPKQLILGLLCPLESSNISLLMKMTATTPILPQQNHRSNCTSQVRRMSMPAKSHVKLPSAQPWIYQRKLSTE